MKELNSIEYAQHAFESMIKGNAYIVYRRKGNRAKELYRVIIKFKKKQDNSTEYWSFICICILDIPNKFIGGSWSEWIAFAANNHEIQAFDTQEEMLKEMSDQAF